jgi:hypothetical protein
LDEAAFWSFWVELLRADDDPATNRPADDLVLSNEEVITAMDAVVPGFSDDYAPPTGCPGVPILAVRDVGYIGDDPWTQAPGERAARWDFGGGSVQIEQVQRHLPGADAWKIFSQVPFQFGCYRPDVAFPWQGAATLPTTPFTMCGAWQVDPDTLPPDLERGDIAWAIGRPSVLRFAPVASTTPPTRDPVAPVIMDYVAGVEPEDPFPLQLWLFAGPALSISPYASWGNELTWCQDSPGCAVDDDDQDGHPAPTDCLDDPTLNEVNASFVHPAGQEGFLVGGYDADCNCVTQNQVTPGAVGLWPLQPIGPMFHHCPRLAAPEPSIFTEHVP